MPKNTSRESSTRLRDEVATLLRANERLTYKSNHDFEKELLEERKLMETWKADVLLIKRNIMLIVQAFKLKSETAKKLLEKYKELKQGNRIEVQNEIMKINKAFEEYDNSLSLMNKTFEGLLEGEKNSIMNANSWLGAFGFQSPEYKNELKAYKDKKGNDSKKVKAYSDNIRAAIETWKVKRDSNHFIRA